MRKKGEEKIEVPTAVASEKVSDYVGAPFYIGQIVTIIKPFDIDAVISQVSGSANKKIITEKFTLLNELVSKLELSGKIVDISEDYESGDNSLTLNLNEQYPFTASVYPFDVLFPEKKTFFVLPQSHCGYIKKAEDTGNESLKSFVSFMSLSANKTLETSCEKVINSRDEVNRYFNELKDCRKRLNDYASRYQETQIRSNTILEQVRAELESKEEMSLDFDDYYKKIFKNKDVKDVSVVKYNGEDCILLVTNELTYKEVGDKHRHPTDKNPLGISIDRCEFNLGSYACLIFKSGRVLASNISKFIGAGYHHPCIQTDSSICMGGEFQQALRNACDGNDFASAIHYIIDFLKDPNSNNPYFDAVNFYFLQDRKWKPENIVDYIGKSSRNEETWDEIKYKKDQEKLLKELKK